MNLRTTLAGLVASSLVVAGGVAYGAHEVRSSSSSSTTAYKDPSIDRQPAYADPGSTPTQTSIETSTTATRAQEVGIVDINTNLDFGQAKAAGTGMILTSGGEILTNHHVVEGATTISVTVVATGARYSADVVGYDTTHDVAVLQLHNASGLDTVTTDANAPVKIGDTVVGVGNANGDGGSSSAAKGSVVALNRSIDVRSESTGASESLSNLIQVAAKIIPGDSGGALYNASGKAIGMNTAASSGSARVSGFAIPIASALSIADLIEQGSAGGQITLGYPAFLGVELASPDGLGGGAQPAIVSGVINNTAAERAGISSGSTVTTLGGTGVGSAAELSAAVATHKAGDSVSVGWTDPSGRAHTATVRLGQGPVG